MSMRSFIPRILQAIIAYGSTFAYEAIAAAEGDGPFPVVAGPLDTQFPQANCGVCRLGSKLHDTDSRLASFFVHYDHELGALFEGTVRIVIVLVDGRRVTVYIDSGVSLVPGDVYRADVVAGSWAWSDVIWAELALLPEAQ